MIKRSKLLIVMALEQEEQGKIKNRFPDVPILFTGIGKVNAAYKLAVFLEKNPRIHNVLNLGTAGSRKFKKGTLVNCNRFFQRDMDCTAFGNEIGETPFEKDTKFLKWERKFKELPEACCGSGDNFATSQIEECEVVDMEAYALAKVCKDMGCGFTSIKYITDGLNDDSVESWNNMLNSASTAFVDFLKREFA